MYVLYRGAHTYTLNVRPLVATLGHQQSLLEIITNYIHSALLRVTTTRREFCAPREFIYLSAIVRAVRAELANNYTL